MHFRTTFGREWAAARPAVAGAVDSAMIDA